jgi:hypothetical protein
MYKLILIFVLLTTAGCIVQQPAVPPRPATEYYEHVLELPRNAQIIEDLGNGWLVYKVEVMGEIRWSICFTMCYRTSSSSNLLR